MGIEAVGELGAWIDVVMSCVGQGTVLRGFVGIPVRGAKKCHSPTNVARWHWQIMVVFRIDRCDSRLVLDCNAQYSFQRPSLGLGIEFGTGQ
jgi:hypothetical protein